MTMTRKEIEDVISGLPDGPHGALQQCLIALGDLREEYGATIFRLAVASICLEAGEPMTPEQQFENFIQRFYGKLVRDGMAIANAEYIESVARSQWVSPNCDSVVIPKDEYHRMLSDLDPPVCRLQFPDGSVPENVREAAEGWKWWADEFEQRARQAGE